MMNSVLALLTVIAVLVVTALIKLPLLPFRLARPPVPEPPGRRLTGPVRPPRRW